MSTLSCAICQPHYIPWIGYFEMIDRADVFVFLDDVQFIKREWKNRNRIRKAARAAEPMWLTVPIAKGSHRARLDQARLSAHGDWSSSHARSMEHAYAQAPDFDPVGASLFQVLRPVDGETLADMNIRGIRGVCDMLGICTPLVRSSELGVDGAKGDKLLGICKAVKADKYIANDRTGEYLDTDEFKRSGVDVEFQHYSHPIYEQRHKGRKLDFLSHLSVVDLLFNQRGDALDIIRSGRPGEGE